MKTMYEKFLQHTGDERTKRAFIDGFRVAMDIYEHRYPSEYSEGNQDHLIDNWIVEKSRYFLVHESRDGSNEDIILDGKTTRRSDFYAMFGTSFKLDDDDHFAIDNDKKPIIDETAEEWPLYVAIHHETGEMLERTDYEQLSSEEASNYQKISYIELFNQEHQPIARIYSDDHMMISYFIADDILDYDTTFYDIMLERATEGDQICQYRDLIEEVATSSDKAKADFVHGLTGALLDMLFGADDDDKDDTEE